jgi:uncharacterized OsmC-like protein
MTAETRRYAVSARSTDTFGRVLWSCRDQHYVADGPIHNGCPGEAITPAELFLAGVAACGVELLQVLAKAEDVPLEGASVEIAGELDPANPGGRARRALQREVTAVWKRRSCDAGCSGRGRGRLVAAARSTG